LPIHDYDTHFWLAKTPVEWISAEDHYSYEPIFQQASRIRIEPLHLAAIQAVLDACIPAGYTAFLRTDIHQDVESNKIARLGYIMALECGGWPEPGKVAIGGFGLDAQGQATAWDGLPIKDGFRAELCCWNGQVAFESSPNFTFDHSNENRVDIYKFLTR
jgi:hypothetical protein